MGERIAAQQRSGISVKQFCKEQGLTEYSFYAWRKRLQKKEPVRFALVDEERRGRSPRRRRRLELVLATGERLRIGAGVEAARSIGMPTFDSNNGRIMEGGGGASIIDLRVCDEKRLSVYRTQGIHSPHRLFQQYCTVAPDLLNPSWF